MILILSKWDDYSTSHVIQWLLFYQKPFKRINEEDEIESINIGMQANSSTEQFLIIKGEKLNFNQIESFWYRRGQFSFKRFLFQELIPDLKINQILVESSLEEIFKIQNYLHFALKPRSKVNKFKEIFLNKLTVLEVAKSCGLLFPDTLVTSNREEILIFIHKHKRIICKPIWEVRFFDKTTEGSLKTLTIEIDQHLIEGKLNEICFPSLFQKK